MPEKPLSTVLVGDAISAVRSLPDRSVDLVVTSPPYWAKAKYSDDEQELGITGIDDYVEYLVALFSEIERVLQPHGLVWINLGDTAAGSGGSGGDYNAGGSRDSRLGFRQVDPGMPKKQWCLVPWRVASSLQSSGWLVRSVVTWDKGRNKRESLSHAKRPGDRWEPVFLLAPAAHNRNKLVYNWHPDRMTEMGNVWKVPPTRSDWHPAPFPQELVRRCMEPVDYSVVLDPFAGSGTVGLVAAEQGKESVLVELVPEFADRIAAVMRPVADVRVKHVG